MLYDGIFKELMNPETAPENLNEVLSLLLGKKVEIIEVMPGDNSRLGSESSLLVMDIVVRLEDGSLDIVKKNMHNTGIQNRLDGWLSFLSSDDPQDILALLERYPDFKALYEHAYRICRNTEYIMGIFSDELRMLDENTVQYMIDEMQETINSQQKTLVEKDKIGRAHV